MPIEVNFFMPCGLKGSVNRFLKALTLVKNNSARQNEGVDYYNLQRLNGSVCGSLCCFDIFCII
jgi:hypothetical protein